MNELSMTSIIDFYNQSSKKELLIGTYLFPYILFDGFDINNPITAIKIISKIEIDALTIFITRNGGVFTRPPVHLQDDFNDTRIDEKKLESKLIFQDKFANLANRLVCDLCTLGVVTEPVTPVHISKASLIDSHALITSAGGGREIYLHRTIEPSRQLIKQTWFNNKIISPSILEEIKAKGISTKLIMISENLPLFISSAYSLFSQQRYGEALIDSWIVVEQILDNIWEKFTSEIHDKTRLDRLNDTRIYSASVRTEVLLLTGKLSRFEYDIIQRARSNRNRLAHRAKISLDWAHEGMMAMKCAIEHVTDIEPAYPQPNRFVTW